MYSIGSSKICYKGGTIQVMQVHTCTHVILEYRAIQHVMMSMVDIYVYIIIHVALWIGQWGIVVGMAHREKVNCGILGKKSVSLNPLVTVIPCVFLLLTSNSHFTHYYVRKLPKGISPGPSHFMIGWYSFIQIMNWYSYFTKHL